MQQPHDERVLIAGGDPLSLIFAFELARIGIPLEIITAENEETEAAILPGGPVSDPGGSLADFIKEAGQEVISESKPPTFVFSRERFFREAEGSAFGVPPYPLAKEMFAALGVIKTLRASLDRIKPVLTLGKTKFLRELIEPRIGAAALGLFAEPQIFFQFEKSTSDTTVAEALPGFNETVTRAGSLTGAVLAYQNRLTEITLEIMPKAGWSEFFEALKERLEYFDVIFTSDNERFQDALDESVLIGTAPKPAPEPELDVHHKPLKISIDRVSPKFQLRVPLVGNKLGLSVARAYATVTVTDGRKLALRLDESSAGSSLIIRAPGINLLKMSEVQLQATVDDAVKALDLSQTDIEASVTNSFTVEPQTEHFASEITRLRQTAIVWRRNIAGIV